MKVEFLKADNVQQSFFFVLPNIYDDFPKKLSDWVHIVKEIQCKFYSQGKKNIYIIILFTEVEITIKHEISGGRKLLGLLYLLLHRVSSSIT